MYLFLDNSNENKIIFIVMDNREGVKKFIFRKRKIEDDLLSCFVKLISKKKICLKNITGIGILIGQGRFTATRIAVIFGNMLSYFLHCPIIGLDHFSIEEFLKKIRKARKRVYLSAKYSGEVNIGKSLIGN